MKFITITIAAVLALTLSACADGTDVSTPPTVIGTAAAAECTPEGLCTETEKASWAAIKRAQCLRLGGSYCR